MKKILLNTLSILFIGAAATLSSCETKNQILKDALAGQTFDAPTTDFTIPIVSGVHTGFISFDSVQVNVDIDAMIRSNTGGALGIDDADMIVIKSLKMQLTNPDMSNNWANLDTVHVYLMSNTSSTPTKIATVINADTYSDLVQGEVNSVLNAKDYLKGNQIFYVFVGTNRRPTTKELLGKVDVKFGIE